MPLESLSVGGSPWNLGTGTLRIEEDFGLLGTGSHRGEKKGPGARMSLGTAWAQGRVRICKNSGHREMSSGGQRQKRESGHSIGTDGGIAEDKSGHRKKSSWGQE